jgi:hypothetical protein
MAPSEDRSTAEKNQAGHRRISGNRRQVRHPRGRACLLKGCERRFRPVHPQTRYCSEECREEARRWREWKARHHYRQSEGGKQKRRAQSRRYRLRSKRARAAKQGPSKPREGHRKKNDSCYLAVPQYFGFFGRQRLLIISFKEKCVFASKERQWYFQPEFLSRGQLLATINPFRSPRTRGASIGVGATPRNGLKHILSR